MFRIARFPDPEILAASCASRLLEELIRLQARQGTVHLGLTGGRTANRIYKHFAEIVPGSQFDPDSLQLWWADERFVPPTHPDRNSQQALAILAKSVPISSANTHIMPAADSKADPSEAAFAYAEELSGVSFDICLLGVGDDGHVASIFPNHPSFKATGKVIGVTNAPEPPQEHISLTLNTLNQSKRIWVIASGISKSAVIKRAAQKDPNLPLSHVNGQISTQWWLDEDAAAELPKENCYF